MQGRALRGWVMLQSRADLRRPRLAVPNLESRQIGAARILERLYEIVAGSGLTGVSLEIEVGAGAELLSSQHSRKHPDDLGALVVDSRRVEIRNLDIAVRSHGMSKRTC